MIPLIFHSHVEPEANQHTQMKQRDSYAEIRTHRPKSFNLENENFVPKASLSPRIKRARKKGEKNAELEQGYETCRKWTVMDLKPAKQKHKSFSILLKSLSLSLYLSLSLHLFLSLFLCLLCYLSF
ncbi:hypothetical protein V8G54_006941, partial [Vigna mungo]